MCNDVEIVFYAKRYDWLVGLYLDVRMWELPLSSFNSDQVFTENYNYLFGLPVTLPYWYHWHLFEVS